MTENVVIIGAGPAGVAAAVQCCRLGLPPLILDKKGRAGGLVENAYSIENYPGLENPVSGPVFANMLTSHLQRFKLSVNCAEALEISHDTKGFKVKTCARVFFSRAVILACGTCPDTDGLPVELSDDRLFYEVHPLLERYADLASVAIIGGGEAACDYALTLASRNCVVHMIVRGSDLKARGRLADLVKSSTGIQFHYGCQFESAQMKNQYTVTLYDKDQAKSVELKVDAVLAACGRKSAAIPFLEQLNVTMPDSITCSMPGLYLVGDARRGSLGQIGMAVGDGIEAAQKAVDFLE